MALIALGCAAAAVLALALPAPGLFVAMGLAIFAIASGLVAYRRAEAPGTSRIAGAAAMTVATITLGLSLLEYSLTLAAVSRMTAMFG